jgi:hypothetical protein
MTQRQLVSVLFAGLLFSPFVAQTQAEITRVGTTAAPFLTIGLGARALGMGGAYTSIASDASCLYWNPAGAASLEKSELMLVKTDWLVDTDLNYLAAVTPFGDYAALGVSAVYLDYGDEEVTTLQEQDGTGEFYQAGDMALGLTYAKQMTNRFSVGVTAKFVQQTIWHMHATTMALDMGTLYRTGFHNMTLGMGIYNVGMKTAMAGTDLLLGHDLDETQNGDNPAVPVALDVYDWPMPIMFRIGASIPVIENPMHQLLISAEAVHAVDRSEALSVGSEYGFRNRFFVRAGYRDLFLKGVEGGLALGAGVDLPLSGDAKLRIDAAYEDYGRLDQAMRYSLSFNW